MTEPDMKHTLYRRLKTKRNGETDEVAVGRSLVWLVWIVLAFVLILLGRSLVGFVHWP